MISIVTAICRRQPRLAHEQKETRTALGVAQNDLVEHAREERRRYVRKRRERRVVPTRRRAPEDRECGEAPAQVARRVRRDPDRREAPDDYAAVRANRVSTVPDEARETRTRRAR